MFQDGRNLDHFPMVRMKYKYMDNIMKLGYRASKRVCGWERDFSKKMCLMSVLLVMF